MRARRATGVGSVLGSLFSYRPEQVDPAEADPTFAEDVDEFVLIDDAGEQRVVKAREDVVPASSVVVPASPLSGAAEPAPVGPQLSVASSAAAAQPVGDPGDAAFGAFHYWSVPVGDP